MAPWCRSVAASHTEERNPRHNLNLFEGYQSVACSTRLPARDLSRARKFYSEKLGLEPVEERPSGLRYRSGNNYFALYKSAGEASGSHTQMGWEVADIEETVEALKVRGAIFEEYDLTGLKTVNGIATITGNYPSKGVGERDRGLKTASAISLALASYCIEVVPRRAQYA
jgi:hypothetical protein